jgi:hypothetical protein
MAIANGQRLSLWMKTLPIQLIPNCYDADFQEGKKQRLTCINGLSLFFPYPEVVNPTAVKPHPLVCAWMGKLKPDHPPDETETL